MKMINRFEIVFAVCAALAMSCMTYPALAAPVETPVAQPAQLTEKDDKFVLNQPLADFYDTAFVLTNGGKSPPKLVGLDELADSLVGYDVIFYGESHRHPGVHLQQQRLFRALHSRFPGFVLSLEQFERDVQPVLGDYLAGRLGETTLIDKGRAWDNYRPSYRPLVQFAKDNNLPVIAAEAPVWTAVCVGQWGLEILDRFTPEERSYVAQDLHVTAGAYRDKYVKFLGGSTTHGNATSTQQASAKADRSFAGQVLRDDTMAESIFLARQRYPGRKILHLNGTFHSDGFLGTVERLRLRDATLKIAVISPIEVSDPKVPAFSNLAVADATVLQLVYPNPAEFAEGEDESEWVRKTIAKRAANPCKYTPETTEAVPAKSVSTETR